MGYWIGLENVVCVCLDVLWCGFVVFLNWIESIVLVCRFMLVMEYKWRGVGEGVLCKEIKGRKLGKVVLVGVVEGNREYLD